MAPLNKLHVTHKMAYHSGQMTIRYEKCYLIVRPVRTIGMPVRVRVGWWSWLGIVRLGLVLGFKIRVSHWGL